MMNQVESHEPESEVVLPEGGVCLPTLVDNIERILVTQALERVGGNKSAAAKLLGLNRTTLVEKMRRMGMPLMPKCELGVRVINYVRPASRPAPAPKLGPVPQVLYRCVDQPEPYAGAGGAA